MNDNYRFLLTKTWTAMLVLPQLIWYRSFLKGSEVSSSRNSDPLKNNWDFKLSSTWMIIIVFCWLKHEPLCLFYLNSSDTDHFWRGLKFRVLENSDPLKNNWDFKPSSTWMIIIVFYWLKHEPLCLFYLNSSDSRIIFEGVWSFEFSKTQTPWK